MGSLESATSSTKKYAKFFGLPLTPESLEKFLITPKPLKIPKNFKNSPKESRLIKSRQQISQDKTKLLFSRLWLFRLIPTIDLVAITGSVAINNAVLADDIDLMIITKNNTLWLTRALIVIVLKIFGWRRGRGVIKDRICDNLYLDQSSLLIPRTKQNLYTAHEVLQIKPVIDRRHTYQRFIQSNSWTKNYLANAYKYCSSSFSSPKLGEDTSLLRGGEVFVRAANFFFFHLQYHFMRSKITNETVTLHSASFHPHNLSRDLEDFLSRYNRGHAPRAV